MGYSFYIGNAVPEFSKEDGELTARWVVGRTENDNAPTFQNDQCTGSSNGRHPSYSGWYSFCEEAGLVDLFYDERGHLLAGHPGCALLTADDLARVRAALHLRRAKSRYPPGFSAAMSANDGECDACLARLIWLEWWISWALENCETPAIQNT